MTDTEQRAREAYRTELRKEGLSDGMIEAIIGGSSDGNASLRALTTLLTQLDDVERERDEARAALRDCVSINTENCRQRDAAEHAVGFQNELVIGANLATIAAEARCARLEAALREIATMYEQRGDMSGDNFMDCVQIAEAALAEQKEPRHD